MPLYEYECTQCHRRLEKIQKFSDAELTVCPHCGGELERTVTAPAIQFKGAGWYKDLYSSAKPPSTTGTETGAAPAGGDAGAPALKTEAAPATTPTAAPATPAASGTGSSNS